MLITDKVRKELQTISDIRIKLIREILYKHQLDNCKDFDYRRLANYLDAYFMDV